MNNKISTNLKLGIILSALLSVLLAANTQAANYNSYYQKEKSYEITVTNITKGQSFTPILAATHKRTISFFELGEPAIEPLAALAESGNIGPLQDLLKANPALVSASTSTEGLLNPGQSTTFVITNSGRFPRFSFAAMLIPTNDTFVALNTVRLPFAGSRTFFANAYDAGSEDNDELCANIPGPACGGAGPSPDNNGEGFVHISAGIHGEADLLASTYDWRGPVAKVMVKRIYP